MNKIKSKIFIFISLLISQILSAQEYGTPKIKNFSELSSEVYRTVWDIAQDSNGLLYFAAEGGLFTYSANKFRFLIHKNAFFSLDIDKRGNIYVGTEMGLQKIYIDSLQYKIHDYPTDIPIRTPWRTFVVSDGVYFFLNNKEVYYKPAAKDSVYMVLRPPWFKFIRGFKVGDTILVVDSNGVGMIKKGKFQILINNLEFATQDIRVIERFDQNNYLFGTKLGNFYLVSTSFNNVKPIELENQDYLRNKIVYTGLKINDTSFVVGTLKGGIYIFDKNGKTLMILNSSNGLISDAIYKIFKDRQNNLWLGTPSGPIKVMTGLPISFITKKNSHFKGEVHTFSQIGKYLLLSTTSGLYYFDLTEPNYVKRNTLKLLSSHFLYIKPFAKVKFKKENFYVSTGYNYLICLDSNLNIVDSLKVKGQSALTCAFNPYNFLIPTYYSLNVYTLKEKRGKPKIDKFYEFKEVSELVLGGFFQNDTLLWLNTFSGIYMINFLGHHKDYKVYFYNTYNGLPNDINKSLIIYKNRLYVSSVYGFYALKDTSVDPLNYEFEKVKSPFGIESDSKQFIESIKETSNFVFIYKNETLYKINKKNGYTDSLRCSCFRKNNVALWNVFELINGKLWFLSNRAVVVVDTNFKNPSKEEINIILLSVDYDNHNYIINQDISNSLTLPLKISPLPRLRFNFVVPIYIGDCDLSFSYKLDGLEDSWSEWRNEDFVDYNGLPKGKYTLLVRVKDMYGHISYGKIKFYVPPLWYLTNFAKFIYFLVTIGFLLLFFKYRTEKINREKKYLEEQIRKRTNVLRKQNEKLEKLTVEIKEKSEALEQETEKLKLVMQELQQLSLVARYTANSVVILNKNGKVEWWNQGFINMFENKLKKYEKLSFREKMKKIRPDLDKKIKEFGKEKTDIPIIYTISVKREDGTDFWFKTIINPVYDQKGNLTKFIAVDIDITDLKLAEKEITTQKIILQEQAEELQQTNSVLLKQKEEIAAKNAEITSSIAYAKRIQEALFPHRLFIKALFYDIFILFKPKSIVSGDFYWFEYRDNVTFAIVGDCTGHGVPGAFMSILSISMIKDTLSTVKNLNAAEILNALREKIIYSLHQRNEPNYSKDGIDLSLLIIHEDEGYFQFAGANSKVLIVNRNKKEIYELKGDRMPIGIHEWSERPFSYIEKEFDDNMIFYMFSDGYQDQLGGPKNKKFFFKQFKDLISRISHLSFEKQKEILEDTHIVWRGKNEQTDDILVIGFKL